MARERKRRRRKRRGKSDARKKRKSTQRGKRRVDPMLRLAGRWPLHEVLLTVDWQEPGEIVQILVARKAGMGQVAAGTFLVDLGCLGVKSAFASLFSSQAEYELELRRRLTSQQELKPADLNLVAKIVREGVAYARELGFSPDPDYRDAMVILGDANPDACDEEIPLGGEDGKPLFIAGPYDDVEAIMRQLTEVCGGPDGFTYLFPIGDPGAFFDDDDWDVEWEE